jgi:HD-GYP domain-containing protein (c-di-GMP phosphodiesterase class II)
MFRLVGLLGGLSLTTDLGTGAPVEESLKRCLVAIRLARAVECRDAEVSDVVYTALLQHLGCTAYAHESGQIWGDDIAVVRLMFLTNFAEPKDVWTSWISGMAAATGRSRARVLATTVATSRRTEAAAPVATCEVARNAARRLGLPESVQTSLFHAVAMWNGKGFPTTAGAAIPLSTRITHVASTAVMFALHAGTDAAMEQVRRRAGRHLDPDLCDVLLDQSSDLLDDLDEVDAYEAVLAAEPDPARFVDAEGLHGVARTFGDLVDLKSPWLHGHSAGVAAVADGAARALELGDQVDAVRVAGYVHDLGRVGVPSRIWDKSGPLSQAERDQARLHAYHSERILSRIPALADVAMLAGQHHERSNGRGYHRGLPGFQLPMA